MDINGMINSALFLAGVGSTIAFFTMVRPAIARATLGHRAKLAEYRVVDAMLDGAIEVDDPAFQELMGYIHMLSEHPREFGLTEFQALAMTLKEAGYKDPSEVPVRLPSYHEMAPAGRAAMIAAEKELHEALTDYLVTGSKWWWLLAPGRTVWRRVRRTPERHPAKVTRPSVVADSYRRAARDGDLRSLLDDAIPQFV